MRGWLLVAGQGVLLLAIALAPRRDPSTAWLAVGGLAFVVGIALALWAGAVLGRALTPTPVPNGAGLVVDGPFARVRHPIYTGLLLAAAGWTIAVGTWWTLGALLGLLVLLAGKARWEDRMLERAYGGPWRVWAARTGALVPRLKP